MPLNEGKIVKACEDMKSLYGMPEPKVKAALSRLLRIYRDEWGFIEENNYEILFENCMIEDEQKEQEEEKKSELKIVQVLLDDNSEPLLKGHLTDHSDEPSTSINKSERSAISSSEDAEAVIEVKEPVQLSNHKRARASCSETATRNIKGKIPEIEETACARALTIDNTNGLYSYDSYSREFSQEAPPLAVKYPGNCLSAPANCACTSETRGDFAYTAAGLLDEKFLRESIAIIRRKNDKKHLFYCENCPLENRLVNSNRNHKRKRSVKPCKGHLMRKFIKECWAKCGCSLNCGNRVVQRGITVKLQVFQASEGKGWGVRTLEALEKGTFVCEYVGEVVTNQELDERNEEFSGDRHTYPVLLDADWASERFLKDEEALCLDATKFGNVARFINHRCYDANLIEIPVEIETPDHHYYHVAFFTTRKVEVNEELNWDYGIDFSDETHPIKAFDCKCGSFFCSMKSQS